MRIEITFINKLSINAIDKTNKITLIDNNDDNKDSKISGNYATLLQNNQNSISDNLILEREGF